MIDHKAEEARTQVAAASRGEIATTDDRSLVALLQRLEPEIERALPGAMDKGRFARIVQTELRKNPKLMEASPQSFMGAVLTAAQLGLEFGPMGQAYLVPYKREIQLIIGYKGWVSLISRNGDIAWVNAEAVHEKDTFDYEYGLDPFLRHKPAEGERGDITHYYAVIKKVNGGANFAVMTREEVLAHRQRYAKKVNGEFVGPWRDNFDEMAEKTVFLQAKKWVPASAEQSFAAHVDNHIVTRASADAEPEVDPFDEDEFVDAEIVGEPPPGRSTPYDQGE